MVDTDISVNTETEILTITLGITETKQNKRQCEQKSPLVFFQSREIIHKLQSSSVTPSPLLLGCCSSVPNVGFRLLLFCCLLW